jgi:hypothetical protein
LPTFVGPEIQGSVEARGGDELTWPGGVVGVVEVVVVALVEVVGVVELVVVVALVEVVVVVVHAEVTLKLVELVAVLPAAVTVSGPLLAAAGTVAVICESESTVKDALVPLKVTAAAPVKPEPAIVTAVPTEPLVGVRAQSHGAIPVWAVPPG